MRRSGRYKISRQTAQCAWFARAAVELGPAAADSVEVTAPGRIDFWRAALVAGATEAIARLRRRGQLPGPVQVDITEFVGVVVDTSQNTAWLATFMAVVAAFPEVEPPRLTPCPTTKLWQWDWPGSPDPCT